MIPCISITNINNNFTTIIQYSIKKYKDIKFFSRFLMIQRLYSYIFSLLTRKFVKCAFKLLINSRLYIIVYMQGFNFKKKGSDQA